MPNYPRKNRNAILHASSPVQWFVSSVQLIAILTLSVQYSSVQCTSIQYSTLVYQYSTIKMMVG